MINLNNYYFAGPKAIIYNVELDHDFLGFYIQTSPYDNSKKILLDSNYNDLEEVGIKYKKASDSVWTTIPLITYNEVISYMITYNTDLCDLLHSDQDQEFENYIIYYPEEVNIDVIKPYRVILKNLIPDTNYNIASYYIRNGVTTEYNSCTVKTLKQRKYFTCGTITASEPYDTQENIDKLTTCITKCCEILSNITSWGNLNEEVVIDAQVCQLANGVAADSSMRFNGPSNISLTIAMHELAHVHMNIVDSWDGDNGFIVKFMEFATYTEGATWKWQGSHNYPCISSAHYDLLFDYYVAAACHVSHYANNNTLPD